MNQKVYTNGLDKFHFAKLTSDAENGVSYDVPVALVNAQQVSVTPKSNTGDVDTDNTTETFEFVSGSDVSIQKSSLSSDELTLLLGEKVTDDGIKTSGEAPYGAFGFRRSFSNGVQRLVWVLKTKFKQPTDTVNTKAANSFNPQYDTIAGTSTRRIADNEWKIYKDSGIGGFTAAEVSNFFSKATLEKLYNVSSTVYGEPAGVAFVDALPAEGMAGIIYIVDGETECTTHYWDGTKFIENTPV